MNIELKKFHRSPRISGAFMAFLYIGGEKAGLVWNRGPGHETGYHHLSPRGESLIRAAELEHRLNQPEHQAAVDSQQLSSLLDELVRNSGKKNKRTSPASLTKMNNLWIIRQNC